MFFRKGSDIIETNTAGGNANRLQKGAGNMNTKDWKPEFRERYLKHADELRWLYCELYHNDLQAFDYFTEMMYQAYLRVRSG